MIATASWQYIILDGSGATGYRVKRRTGGSAPPINQSGTDTVNTDYWSKTAPPSIPFNNLNYVFAFWSITAVDLMSPQREAHIDGINAFDSHPGSPVMGGGLWNLTAKAYYVWDFGAGGGDNAMLIDAFDLTAGDFFGDDFVKVLPDPTEQLSIDANNGYIDTDDPNQIPQAGMITVTADDSVGNKKFAYWQDVSSLTFPQPPNGPTINGPDLVVHADDRIVAFAFYNEVSTPLIPFPNGPGIFNWWWWIETHGGVGPDGGPGGGDPWAQQIVAAISLAVAARNVAPQLRTAVLEIALKQLAVAAQSIEAQIKQLNQS